MKHIIRSGAVDQKKVRHILAKFKKLCELMHDLSDRWANAVFIGVSCLLLFCLYGYKNVLAGNASYGIYILFCIVSFLLVLIPLVFINGHSTAFYKETSFWVDDQMNEESEEEKQSLLNGPTNKSPPPAPVAHNSSLKADSSQPPDIGMGNPMVLINYFKEAADNAQVSICGLHVTPQLVGGILVAPLASLLSLLWNYIHT